MTLAELNSLDQSAFIDSIGWVCEHSPWVAERAWKHRPFDTVEALHSALTTEIADAARDEQLALLRAHPDLGTRAKISDASTGEQAGAGFDRLTPEEFERLTSLNETYRRKFGFPFLYAVTGSTKDMILDALTRRVDSTPEAEFTEALRQVGRIVRFRLGSLFE